MILPLRLLLRHESQGSFDIMFDNLGSNRSGSQFSIIASGNYGCKHSMVLLTGYGNIISSAKCERDGLTLL